MVVEQEGIEKLRALPKEARSGFKVGLEFYRDFTEKESRCC